jgi:O-methyltransferase involved in polyketide biosynthesis
VCALRRVALDLSDAEARRALFDEIGRRAGKALILAEGLIIYLTPEEVGSLAHDLAAPDTFRLWVTDLASPGLLRMLKQHMGARLGEGGAVLKFAPEEGPAFFTAHGWTPVEVRSLLKTAAGLKRLPFRLRLMALLPESKGRQGNRPWSAVCLLERS